MIRTKNIFISFLLAMMSSGIMFGQQDSVNLALEATVSTSFVSGWETLGAVNDGFEPTSSDKTGTAYGNWNGEGDYGIYNWVQYDWTNAVNISSTAVYWWDDNPGDIGIAQPTEAYIEYWNGEDWVKAGDIGTDLDTYNSLYIGGVWTQKIRITMKSPAATGILEWKVFGQTGGDCDPTTFGITIKINGSDTGESDFVSILIGDDLILTADPQSVGQYYWSGPNGFSATGNVVSFQDMQADESGKYSVIFINECGAVSRFSIPVTVKLTADGSAYSWPAYDPPIYYDFRDEFPAMEMPTQDLNDCSGVVKTVSSGWWTFKMGPNANHLVTDTAINAMLARLNKDFAYFRDTLGWPPDKRAKRGYRSAVYLYGSGLCTDNEDSLATGGWQGNIYYQGENWPMVLLSYVPVASFDPYNNLTGKDYQTGAVVHEGIHSILADLPGARNSAWFHEGGNTWLQQEMESQKSGDYSSMGFLNAGALIAPFMPIECYSGWLQDESFGGPSAEGVNMSSGGQQICTWKNLLGGNQYGNIFPVIFSQIFGDHSVAWIWRYCENRVLEGIADTLGDYQTRRLITEYRAKQALLDIGKWTGACRKLIDNNFGGSIKAEWQPSWLNPPVWNATPYPISSVDETGLLIPEYRTTPGWSGSNQIPLIVDADTVTVEFLPIGENMSCQLCYRAEDGSMVYGEPVLGGECTLKLDKKPANAVIFAVICNTDYIYEGEQTRKAHFDYQLKLGNGIKERANWNTRWYRWDSNLSNTAVPVTTADFIASANSIPAGSALQFTDKSKNIVRGWLWDFGDGETSTEQNPSHTYSTAGTYSVSLTVLGTNGAVTATKSNYIIVGSTGILDIKEDNSIVLFPNPARESCTVTCPEGILSGTDLKIFNANGKELILKSSINENSFDIDLSAFSSGMYYISVITDNIPVTKKLIVLK